MVREIETFISVGELAGKDHDISFDWRGEGHTKKLRSPSPAIAT
ncbi:MAG: hypothetical protein ACLFM4_06015 [Phormidium sp.]